MTAEALGRGGRGGGLQVHVEAFQRSLATVPATAGAAAPGPGGAALLTAAQIEAAATGPEGGLALTLRPAVSDFRPGWVESAEMPATRGGDVPQRAEEMQPRSVGAQVRAERAAAGKWERAGAIWGRAPAPEHTGNLGAAIAAPGGCRRSQDAGTPATAGAQGAGGVRVSGEGTAAPPERARWAGILVEQPKRGPVQGDGFEEMLARLARRERLEFAR